ncbi:MAG: hypothetical protein ACR2PN_02535 [Luminiphilus sp.]
MGKKTPESIRKDQLRVAKQWLDLSWPRHRIYESAAQAWEFNHAETDALIAEVRSEYKSSMSVERTEFLAQQMTRLEALAAKAQEDGQLGVALGCYKELHLLASLVGK